MSIAAVRIMAAGGAGLAALPHFVNEFAKLTDFPQLAPRAFDHDSTPGAPMSQVVARTREIVGEATWNSIHFTGGGRNFTTHLTEDTEAISIVNTLNPEALTLTGMARQSGENGGLVPGEAT